MQTPCPRRLRENGWWLASVRKFGPITRLCSPWAWNQYLGPRVYSQARPQVASLTLVTGFSELSTPRAIEVGENEADNLNNHNKDFWWIAWLWWGKGVGASQTRPGLNRSIPPLYPPMLRTSHSTGSSKNLTQQRLRSRMMRLIVWVVDQTENRLKSRQCFI